MSRHRRLNPAGRARVATALALGVLALAAPPAAEAADQFLGEIRIFGGDFAPRGWMFCEGQPLSISAYSSLYTLLGTNFGGDGRTTFRLPDLRGRMPIHAGQGAGLSARTLGQKVGSPRVFLGTAQLPVHSHTASSGPLMASGEEAELESPADAVVAVPGGDAFATGGTTAAMSAAMLGPVQFGTAGNSQSTSTLPPALGVRYIIAVTGSFPVRQ